jgi:hypothetical protein
MIFQGVKAMEIEYHVKVKVFVDGSTDEAIERAAQNAAKDIDSLLCNRTIKTEGCNIRYEVE